MVARLGLVAVKNTRLEELQVQSLKGFLHIIDLQVVVVKLDLNVVIKFLSQGLHHFLKLIELWLLATCCLGNDILLEFQTVFAVWRVDLLYRCCRLDRRILPRLLFAEA